MTGGRATAGPEAAAGDPARLRFGLEAESALVHDQRGFCDVSSLTFAEVQRIVDRLPDHGDPTSPAATSRSGSAAGTSSADR